ncbi:NADH-quinone oxidoreductase subunit K [Nonomuraea maritima]|uniref:NADH-quinone oxidoreductase subunit K n=1 Tax=Nonomuraea maritima TaxID=683260 RepID=A0A1G9MX85_9ACTN|nr:NADH-quinone oxidoreductase subunit NuoK [Nonomuraea maritima]SDL78743.1 NADH-quinone oxidoreductase subunit K [Nonomuraea maritima]
MHVVYPVVVSALLFSIGVYGVLARRNTILVLMSVELMLNAVNLNLVAFDVWLGDRLHSGQVLTLFVIVIAAAEVGLGLAIILALYRNRRTVDLDHLRDLAEPEPADAADNDAPPAFVAATAGQSPASPGKAENPASPGRAEAAPTGGAYARGEATGSAYARGEETGGGGAADDGGQGPRRGGTP